MTTPVRVAISGEASGFAPRLVEALQARGDRVALLTRTEVAASDFRRAFPDTVALVGDLSGEGASGEVAGRVATALGGVDVLIHDVFGTNPEQLVPLVDTEPRQLEEALSRRVLNPFRLTQALLGALEASVREDRRALVLHILARSDVARFAESGIDGACRAAVQQLARTWDDELLSRGVRVRAIDPGDRCDGDATPTPTRPTDSVGEIISAIDALTRPGRPAHVTKPELVAERA